MKLLANRTSSAAYKSRPSHGLPKSCIKLSKTQRVGHVVQARKSLPAATSRCNLSCRAENTNGATATAQSVPTTAVLIDNTSDAFATKVTVHCSTERAGELLDTVTALKNLGLNIRKAKLEQTTGGMAANTFYITDSDTSEKIVRSARLEEIRMTILNALETKEEAATSARPAIVTRDFTPLGVRRSLVQTTIDVSEAPNGTCSILKISTTDRPGLLVDIVSVLKDINLNVVSAEVDTIGKLAKDEFFITYHGEPLSAPMVQLVNNALQYYLSLNEVAKEESY